MKDSGCILETQIHNVCVDAIGWWRDIDIPARI